MSIGDEVSLATASQKQARFTLAAELFSKRAALPWFQVDHNKFSGKVTAEPTRSDIHMNVKERLIVELYNK
jgi:small subunit ribosomal protein S4